MYKVFRFERARDSLGKIIGTYNIKEMRIPYYLCDSVRHTLVKEGCKPVFYHIDDNFMPSVEFDTSDFILYPDYFGICTENVKRLAKIYPKLIVDNAHSYFSEPSGFACFNSAYKFGLDNCSYLWLKTDEKSDIVVPKYEQKREERKNKFLELNRKYFSTNLLKIDKNSVPFCYPYLAKDEETADSLVKELKKEGYTIYRYWNQLPKNYNEYKFYSRLVPIPVLK